MKQVETQKFRQVLCSSKKNQENIKYNILNLYLIITQSFSK
jgi:hypothetical protein